MVLFCKILGTFSFENETVLDIEKKWILPCCCQDTAPPSKPIKPYDKQYNTSIKYKLRMYCGFIYIHWYRFSWNMENFVDIWIRGFTGVCKQAYNYIICIFFYFEDHQYSQKFRIKMKTSYLAPKHRKHIWFKYLYLLHHDLNLFCYYFYRLF